MFIKSLSLFFFYCFYALKPSIERKERNKMKENEVYTLPWKISFKSLPGSPSTYIGVSLYEKRVDLFKDMCLLSRECVWENMWMILDGMVFLKVPKTRNTISRKTRREKGSTFSVGVTLVLVYFGLIPRNCLVKQCLWSYLSC